MLTFCFGQHAESMKEWEEAKKEERRSELLDLAGEHEKW